MTHEPHQSTLNRARRDRQGRILAGWRFEEQSLALSVEEEIEWQLELAGTPDLSPQLSFPGGTTGQHQVADISDCISRGPCAGNHKSRNRTDVDTPNTNTCTRYLTPVGGTGTDRAKQYRLRQCLVTKRPIRNWPVRAVATLANQKPSPLSTTSEEG